MTHIMITAMIATTAQPVLDMSLLPKCLLPEASQRRPALPRCEPRRDYNNRWLQNRPPICRADDTQKFDQLPFSAARCHPIAMICVADKRWHRAAAKRPLQHRLRCKVSQ